MSNWTKRLHFYTSVPCLFCTCGFTSVLPCMRGEMGGGGQASQLLQQQEEESRAAAPPTSRSPTSAEAARSVFFVLQRFVALYLLQKARLTASREMEADCE